MTLRGASHHTPVATDFDLFGHRGTTEFFDNVRFARRFVVFDSVALRVVEDRATSAAVLVVQR